MKRFDPSSLAPLAEQISVMPAHDANWSKQLTNWWAGTTLAAPTSEAAAPASQCIKTVRRLAKEGLDRLNEYYVEQTQWARQMVRQALDEDENAPVLLEASGTAAILLATRIFAHNAFDAGADSFFTITTSEGGALVPGALTGEDPSEKMFQPTTGLFYQAQPVLPYPSGNVLPAQVLDIEALSNDQIVVELRRIACAQLEAGHKVGCLVLPHVVKSGRILPLAAVCQTVKELRPLGLTLYLVVDDCQGFGRLESEAVAHPLQWCDAYLFCAQKALGGLLAASAIVIQPKALEQFVELCQSGRFQPAVACLSHFQLPPDLEARLPDAMFKRGAVSLPEVIAMASALYWHLGRGQGESYGQRRCSQLALVAQHRHKIVEALKQVSAIEVLEPSPGRPMVPSIITFRLPAGLNPEAVRNALKEGKQPIVTGGAVGQCLRLDIPEYRAVPSVDILVSQLRRVLEQSDKR